jgi:predicted metal-dependent hydrolase
MTSLKYLSGYSEKVQNQVADLVAKEALSDVILRRYPNAHNITSAKALYDYAQEIKQSYMRKSPPLSKVIYDDKVHVIQHALGVHTYVSRVQGSKLKAKNEIKIATVFRKVPEAFLRMILVHELAHFKEKSHNKAFYKLCQYMEPEYHQLEFDMRLYLTHIEAFGELY